MINQSKLGLTLGIFAGVVHLVWSMLVAGGWAQPFMNWVMGLHFMQSTTTVIPFDAMNALRLVILAFVVGNLLGWVIGGIWNMLAKK